MDVLAVHLAAVLGAIRQAATIEDVARHPVVGDAREALKMRVGGAMDARALASHAHYFSTHCLHDHHDQCKVACKHCTERCKCDCHGEA